jgi:ATP-dependent DNA helicase RecQ
VGKPSLVKALTGSAASNVRADRVKHFGVLAGASPTSINQAIDDLADQGYLAFYETEEGFKLLRVMHEALDGVPRDSVTLKAKRQPKAKDESQPERPSRTWADRQQGSFTRTAPPSPEDDRPPTPEEADLFERLRGWRKVVANRLNLPPYVIFHDKTLWAIAREKPTTEDELLQVKGVGRSHIEKYGADLLDLVTEDQ